MPQLWCGWKVFGVLAVATAQTMLILTMADLYEWISMIFASCNMSAERVEACPVLVLWRAVIS